MKALKLDPVGFSGEVPFMDLHALHAPLKHEIEERISALASSSSFILGEEVERFENHFAGYCEAAYAVGCNSGTSAIHMGMCALDIGPGDEVITVSHTFIGSVWGVIYCGAKPVFCDIDPVTMNIDVAQVEARITAQTRAILAVHLYGQPVDIAPLKKLADQYGLYLIEDAAQAHGARYQGRRVGSLGDLACFSFYPGKNLGAWGDAGAVVTSDTALAERLRRIRNHGASMRYEHLETGFNYRMDAIQAAVLDIKLRYLDEWNTVRRQKAASYASALSGLDIVLPEEAAERDHVYHLFVIRHPLRETISEQLAGAGISTGLHYPVPLHRQPVIRTVLDEHCILPETDRAAQQVLSLPLHPCLSDDQQYHVIKQLAEILKSL